MNELDYLKYTPKFLLQTIPNFQSSRLGNVTAFTCPVCKSVPPTCRYINTVSFKFACLKQGCTCRGKDIFTVLSEQNNMSREDSIRLFITTLKLTKAEEQKVKETVYDVEALLKFYSESKFDLVPVTRHNKAPIEKDWTNKTHTDIEEWKYWLNENMLNIGVKTGARSNLTVVDFDNGEVPEEMKKMMGDTLIQKTRQGYHYFYTYEPDLATSRIDDLKIDILNDGKQCILYPSVIDAYKREFITPLRIEKMSEDLKQFIKQRTGKVPLTRSFSEIAKEDIDTENFNMDIIPEGSRNSFMIRMGGILRKELNLNQTGYALDIVNKHFCKPSLEPKEFRAILDQLNKYVSSDLNDISAKVLKYLKIMEEATGKDVQEVTGEKKEIVDKCLAFLMREGYVIRKHRMYHAIKKAEWKEDFPVNSPEVNFKMPYFGDIAHFNYGDMILLGGRSKVGKTTTAMNFIKQFVEQGVKPYYLYLETGSRFVKSCHALGLRHGDFHHAFVSDPSKIELEPNGVTIIDWLLIDNYAETDKVLKYFVDQLNKTNGFLIIFMQLKSDNSWFAGNMVNFFPALAARYIYDDIPETYGTTGAWEIDAIRDPKGNKKTGNIPCIYDWKEKTLKVQTENKKI